MTRHHSLTFALTLHEQFRDACPPHKVKDLDALVKQCKGDEVKIQAKITEWWEEPQVEEPQWEAVGKVNKKSPVPEKKEKVGDRGGDRGGLRSDGRGRGGLSGGGRRDERPSGGGGRDGTRKDGRGAGRGGGGGRNGDRDRSRGGEGASSSPTPTPAPKPKEEPGIPTPVTNVQGPKGAWGGGQSFAAAAAASSVLKPPPATPTVQAAPVSQVSAAPKEQAPIMEPEEEVPVDLGRPAVNMISPADPMPSGLLTPAAPFSPPAKTTGNVWGTKGGAHLIQAEKKPIPAPAPLPLSPEVVEPDHIEPEPELEKDSSFAVSLDGVLPPSVNGANINASGWEPIVETDSMSQQQMSQPSPVRAISVDAASSMPEPEPVLLPKPTASVSLPVAPAPASGGIKSNSVLNMGHWETGDGDDDLDFGFGSFGAPENDTDATVTEKSKGSSSANASSAANAPHASPARPPPGLSMPPMPAGAMLVHELENKLEAAALAPKVDSNNGSDHATSQPSQPQLFMNPPGMSQYGGMGMYNIPPPGMHSGLASMPPPGQFPLDTGVNQQQVNIQLNNSRPGNPPSQLNQAGQQPQQGQYGMQQTSSASNNSGAPSSDAPNAGAPGMPPGMPSMQYPNPAYMYAAGAVPGQFNQMGHPAYGMQAAAYGYGQQFAPQGGHQYGGYNQGLMGQGGGYGAPQHYDDQRGGPRGGAGGNMRDDNQGGGYNKGGGRGGYRGNRSHHQNSHQAGYGNNYPANPNLGGYGAGPYNMAYGGYGNPGGPSGMDPYAMQQHQQGGGGYGGFPHQDNDHKKSLGPHGGNQQAGGFQQQSHLHQQQLGLQGTSTDAGAGGGASGGWPGPRQQNWGSGDWQQEN